MSSLPAPPPPPLRETIFSTEIRSVEYEKSEEQKETVLFDDIGKSLMILVLFDDIGFWSFWYYWSFSMILVSRGHEIIHGDMIISVIIYEKETVLFDDIGESVYTRLVVVMIIMTFIVRVVNCPDSADF